MAEARRRGDTQVALAQQLGVSYERLGQWRRGEVALRAARRSVHERAAYYMRVPVVVVLALAECFVARDFLWPSQDSALERLALELDTMRQDLVISAFMPESLAAAPVEVQWFVVWLYKDLKNSLGADLHHWHESLRALGGQPV
ncbi:hypothetical protein [Variovorax paradoxus]|uniref:hypothetical protein n=1 Tax=Variovorax paradoxus TaxID=34073 RepID=UPI0019328BFD|nr:hypothetical protein INQ48_35675 [Variovorax paradoxus]